MPAQRPIRPRTRPMLVAPDVNDSATSRALADVSASVGELERNGTRSRTRFDLVVGDNRITHGLGRVPFGANVTPTVADASFAWALTDADERTAIITVVGVDQPGAPLEFY